MSNRSQLPPRWWPNFYASQSQLENITIKSVQDRETTQLWSSVAGAGFDMLDFVIENLYTISDSIGYGPDRAMRHYLAWHREQAVSTTSLLLGA